MGVRIHGNDIDIPGVATIGQLALDFLAVLKLVRTQVSLIADDQPIDVALLSHIALSSDNATSTNRNFVLNQGLSGQILILEWEGTNAGRIDDNSANSDNGNVRLSADWVPTEFDTIVLLSNGVDWIEICRSTN